MQKLRDFYPTFEQIDAGKRNSAFPEITDEQLRSALLGNAALSADILELILDMLELEEETLLKDPKVVAALNAICATDLPELLLAIGAAAFSDQLAMQAANDLGALESAGIERPILRQALRFRAFSLRDVPLDALNRDALIAQGNKCLQRWLLAQSIDVAKVLRLRLPVAVLADDSDTLKAAQVKVAQTILDDLALVSEAAA